MEKVFISHNSEDREFVERLAAELALNDIQSWIAEAEVMYGESLLGKISSVLAETDVVLAILSKNSINSNWVRKELELAMTKEINSKRIVVVPICIDSVDIPFFLTDKLYADFRDERSFSNNVRQLVVSINYHRNKKKQKQS